MLWPAYAAGQTCIQANGSGPNFQAEAFNRHNGQEQWTRDLTSCSAGRSRRHGSLRKELEVICNDGVAFLGHCAAPAPRGGPKHEALAVQPPYQPPCRSVQHLHQSMQIISMPPHLQHLRNSVEPFWNDRPRQSSIHYGGNSYVWRIQCTHWAAQICPVPAILCSSDGTCNDKQCTQQSIRCSNGSSVKELTFLLEAWLLWNLHSYSLKFPVSYVLLSKAKLAYGAGNWANNKHVKWSKTAAN